MKVLFAVDGTPGADVAVRQVGQLLNPTTDSVALYFALPEVIVRHASSSQEMTARARQAIADAVFDDARPGLPDALAKTVTLITDEHVPADGVRHAAEDWGADLVVIGARGLGTVERFLLGSVSQAVVQTSKQPVLVVRPNPEHRKNQPLRMLYAYDGSASATAALRLAEKLAAPTGTEVIAVGVIEPLTAGKVPEWILKKARDADTEAMCQAWEREHEADKQKARDELAAFMAKQSAPFNRAEVVIAEGHAAEQILQLVHDRQVDLVVLGTHGPRLIERLFIGSTSDKVLNYAPCSVLLVRDTK
jgi:nucleotide-binding universal stress UspA family protein